MFYLTGPKSIVLFYVYYIFVTWQCKDTLNKLLFPVLIS